MSEKWTPLTQVDDKPEKRRQERLETRKFWVLWVPLAAIGAFIICLMTNSGSPFFPAWGGIAIVIWAIDSGRKDERS